MGTEALCATSGVVGRAAGQYTREYQRDCGRGGWRASAGLAGQHDGKKISLSQFRGKQLCSWRFMVGTSPCLVANLSARKADYSQFQALHIQILGIQREQHLFPEGTRRLARSSTPC